MRVIRMKESLKMLYQQTRADEQNQGLLNVNESYSPQTLLAMNLTLSDAQYAESSARLAFLEQVLQRLGRLPGGPSAPIVTHMPYANGGGVSTFPFSIEGRPPAQRGEIRDAILQSSSPN